MNAAHNYPFDTLPNRLLNCVIPNDSTAAENLVTMCGLDEIFGQWGVRRIYNDFECPNRFPTDAKNALDICPIRFYDRTFVGDNLDN